MNNRIPICFLANNDHVANICKCLESILKYKTPNDEFIAYILKDNLSTENLELFLKLQNKLNFQLKMIPIESDLFINFRIPEICNSEDKIIYINNDITITSSINEFFNTNINNFYLGIALDNSEHSLINSDVILFNAKKWRKDMMSLKYILQNKKFKKEILYLKKWQIKNSEQFQRMLIYTGK